MSLFIDEHKRIKSPAALAALGMAVLDMVIFGLLYAVLAEPLYNIIVLGKSALTFAAQSAVISLAGTAICCLGFLLPDKRLVPYGFLGLAVALFMFYAAAAMLDESMRGLILKLITMYGLPPVIMGNIASWCIYLRIRKNFPAAERKTIMQELKEASLSDGRIVPEGKNTGKVISSPAGETHVLPQDLKTSGFSLGLSSDTPKEAKESKEDNFDDILLMPPAGPSPEEEAMMLFLEDEEEDE